ncbi:MULTISPECIES: AsmA family protein [Pseudomonas]|uniref:AsmA family protein n=1 Tax=Pseudomonas quercus TaxID=2722792 RepID=A0ABX0YBJ5_9PSED|nr:MULTISPECIES: AsmA family protein [Pseudomonas]MBF7142197.1 AsmA family protein [Pseudomonas sp. LY10J]NJP00735.1 AsmA family protein [Pseudomonas quercus]
MKAFGKILGLVILGLLLIVVALGFALTHFFDPNDYKSEIRQLARDKAHVELTLNGDIGWSLFPWLGLELHDASVATLAQPQQPFANLQLLGLSVRVLPLLRHELQMSDVRVDGLDLNLVRNAQGHGNWEDFGKPLPSEAAPAAPDSSPAEAPSSPDRSRPLKLDIDSLTVNNARVAYLDEHSGRSFTAESIQLSTGAVQPATDIPVTLTAFLGTNQPELRARTELKGTLRFDPSVQRYQFEDMRLGGELSGAPLQGKTITFAAQGQLLADLAANVADWNNLKLSANQLRALGELHVRDLDTTPQLSGALSVAQLDVRAFLDGIGQAAPATADPTALTQVELVSTLKGNANALALEDLNIKLDGSTLTGRVAVDDIAAQALRITLQGDTLNLDRYLPAQSEEAKGTAAARQAEVQGSEAAAMASGGNSPLPDAPGRQAWSDDRLFPIERLRAIDLQTELSLNQLTLQKLTIDKAHLTATGHGGLLNLQGLSGQIAQGDFNASGTLDVRPDVPALSLKTKLNRVPVDVVLATHTNPPPVRGLLTLDAAFTGAGNSQKALVDTLNGNGRFTVDNGVLVNANLEQQLCQGIALLNRKTLTSEPRGRDTPFQRLEGSLTVRDGVANNPDFKASIPGLRASGNGDIDLRVLGLDYRVGVVVEGESGNMADPACEVNDRFANLELPIRCRGPLELGARACRVDRDGLGQLATQAVRNRVQEKIEDKLGDKVPSELKDALKGLFKR